LNHSKTLRLLITGATGFIGRNLCKQAVSDGWDVRPATRDTEIVGGVKVGDLSVNTDWSVALKNVDIVIHLAARVQIMDDTANNPLEEYRRINTDATLALAKQAEKSGVKRFIYLSTIKVNGESTLPGFRFKPDDEFIPTEPYALSKYETEQGLLKIARESQMEIVIIRPPLVYGPEVKANFLSMMKWLHKRIPLPFGAIHNKRSFVALDNLVDLILTCIDHPAAVNQVFLVSDGEDLSTTELLNRVSAALDKKPRLLPVNQQLLEFVLVLLGKKEMAKRLFGSLQIDISKTKEMLNWSPPVSVDQQLQKTAQHFLESSRYE